MGSPVLDSKFDWFWILVAGQKAPQVIVDDTRAAAAEFTALAKSVGDTGPRIEALRAQIAQALPPDVAEQFSKASRMFSDSMPDLNAGAGQLGESLTKLALDVEKTNYSIIIQVSAFAASAVLALLTPFTAWLVPGIIAAARLVVAQLISRLVTAAMTLARLAVPGITRILQAVEKLRWLGRILAAAGTEAVQEVAQEGLAQGIQIAQGHRALSNIDGNSLAQAAGWGALAGAQIKGLGDLAQTAAHRAGKPGAVNNVVFSAANQALGETTVGTASALANGMPLDDVWMGTVSGAATTLAHHGAHTTGHAAATAMGVTTPGAGAGMDSSRLGGFGSLEKLDSTTGSEKNLDTEKAVRPSEPAKAVTARADRSTASGAGAAARPVGPVDAPGTSNPAKAATTATALHPQQPTTPAGTPAAVQAPPQDTSTTSVPDNPAQTDSPGSPATTSDARTASPGSPAPDTEPPARATPPSTAPAAAGSAGASTPVTAPDAVASSVAPQDQAPGQLAATVGSTVPVGPTTETAAPTGAAVSIDATTGSPAPTPAGDATSAPPDSGAVASSSAAPITPQTSESAAPHTAETDSQHDRGATTSTPRVTTTGDPTTTPTATPVPIVDGLINTPALPAAFVGLDLTTWTGAVAATVEAAGAIPTAQQETLDDRAGQLLAPHRETLSRLDAAHPALDVPAAVTSMLVVHLDQHPDENPATTERVTANLLTTTRAMLTTGTPRLRGGMPLRWHRSGRRRTNRDEPTTAAVDADTQTAATTTGDGEQATPPPGTTPRSPLPTVTAGPAGPAATPEPVPFDELDEDRRSRLQLTAHALLNVHHEALSAHPGLDTSTPAARNATRDALAQQIAAVLHQHGVRAARDAARELTHEPTRELPKAQTPQTALPVRQARTPRVSNQHVSTEQADADLHALAGDNDALSRWIDHTRTEHAEFVTQAFAPFGTLDEGFEAELADVVAQIIATHTGTTPQHLPATLRRSTLFGHVRRHALLSLAADTDLFDQDGPFLEGLVHFDQQAIAEPDDSDDTEGAPARSAVERLHRWHRRLTDLTLTDPTLAGPTTSGTQQTPSADGLTAPRSPAPAVSPNRAAYLRARDAARTWLDEHPQGDIPAGVLRADVQELLSELHQRYTDLVRWHDSAPAGLDEALYVLTGELSHLLRQDLTPALDEVTPTSPAHRAALEQARTALDATATWLSTHPDDHPDQQRVSTSRDRLRQALALLQMAGSDDVEDLEDALHGELRILSAWLGRRFTPAPSWAEDPTHPTTIAHRAALEPIRTALDAADTWLSENSDADHLDRHDVERARLQAQRVHGAVLTARTSEDLAEVAEPLQSALLSVSAMVGRRLTAPPAWAADPTDPTATTHRSGLERIGTALEAADAWRREHPADHHDWTAVRRLRQDLRSAQGRLVLAGTETQVRDAVRRLPTTMDQLSTHLGRRLTPLPDWARDPADPASTAYRAGLERAHATLEAAGTWLSENPRDHDGGGFVSDARERVRDDYARLVATDDAADVPAAARRLHDRLDVLNRRIATTHAAGTPILDGRLNAAARPATFADLDPTTWADALAATVEHTRTLPADQRNALLRRAGQFLDPHRETLLRLQETHTGSGVRTAATAMLVTHLHRHPDENPDTTERVTDNLVTVIRAVLRRTPRLRGGAPTGRGREPGPTAPTPRPAQHERTWSGENVEHATDDDLTALIDTIQQRPENRPHRPSRAELRQARAFAHHLVATATHLTGAAVTTAHLRGLYRTTQTVADHLGSTADAVRAEHLASFTVHVTGQAPGTDRRTLQAAADRLLVLIADLDPDTGLDVASVQRAWQVASTHGGAATGPARASDTGSADVEMADAEAPSGSGVPATGRPDRPAVPFEQLGEERQGLLRLTAQALLSVHNDALTAHPPLDTSTPQASTATRAELAETIARTLHQHGPGAARRAARDLTRSSAGTARPQDATARDGATRPAADEQVPVELADAALRAAAGSGGPLAWWMDEADTDESASIAEAFAPFGHLDTAFEAELADVVVQIIAAQTGIGPRELPPTVRRTTLFGHVRRRALLSLAADMDLLDEHGAFRDGQVFFDQRAIAEPDHAEDGTVTLTRSRRLHLWHQRLSTGSTSQQTPGVPSTEGLTAPRHPVPAPVPSPNRNLYRTARRATETWLQENPQESPETGVLREDVQEALQNLRTRWLGLVREHGNVPAQLDSGLGRDVRILGALLGQRLFTVLDENSDNDSDDSDAADPADPAYRSWLNQARTALAVADAWLTAHDPDLRGDGRVHESFYWVSDVQDEVRRNFEALLTAESRTDVQSAVDELGDSLLDLSTHTGHRFTPPEWGDDPSHPTAVAQRTGLELVRGALSGIGTWLAAHPGLPTTVSAERARDRLQERHGELQAALTASSVQRTVRSVRETLRALTRETGHRFTQPPAWAHDRTDPTALLFHTWRTRVRNALEAAAGWLADHPESEEGGSERERRRMVEVAREHVNSASRWLSAVDTVDDIRYAVSDLPGDLALLATALERDVAPHRRWAEDSDDPAAAAYHAGLRQARSAAAAATAWLNTHEGDSFAATVHDRRDRLWRDHGRLLAAGTTAEVEAAAGGVRWSVTALSEYLGERFTTPPRWAENPDDPTATAHRAGLDLAQAALRTVTTWLDVHGEGHAQHAAVEQVRRSLSRTHGRLVAADTSTDVANVTRVLRSDVGVAAGRLGERVTGLPDWAREENHPTAARYRAGLDQARAALDEADAWRAARPGHRWQGVDHRYDAVRQAYGLLLSTDDAAQVEAVVDGLTTRITELSDLVNEQLG